MEVITINKIANKDSIIKIYIISHKPYFQFNSEVFVPISPKEYGLNYLTADNGDNIAHLNYLLSEYSTFYWVWKNDLESEYVGFFHYRRYLYFKEKLPSINNLSWKKNDLCNLLNKYDFIARRRNVFSNTVYDEYCNRHGYETVNIVVSIITSKFPPEYLDAYNSVCEHNYACWGNMFICKRELFDDYMDFVFKIFNSLLVEFNIEYEPRELGYIGELLFNVYLEYLIKYTDFKVGEVPWVIVYDEAGTKLIFRK